VRGIWLVEKGEKYCVCAKMRNEEMGRGEP